LLLIGGHVVAVLLHLLRHDNLIVPMEGARECAGVVIGEL